MSVMLPSNLLHSNLEQYEARVSSQYSEVGDAANAANCLWSGEGNRRSAAGLVLLD